jgi:hypothetical protein
LPGIAGAVRLGQAHLRHAAAKDRVEGFGEILVDGVESQFKFFLGGLVELNDGLLRVGDGSQQVVALAREEGEALLAFVEFFKRHHVDGTHGFDALLHLAVIGFRDGQLFAGHESGFRGDQVFGLRVDLAHARFAQVLAVGVVFRAVHFRVAALLAQFL